MYRNAGRWTSRSLLMDSWVPTWLAIGANARPRKKAEKDAYSAQLASSVKIPDLNKQDAPLASQDGNALPEEERHVERGSDVVADIGHAPLPPQQTLAALREAADQNADRSVHMVTAQGTGSAPFERGANGGTAGPGGSLYRTYSGMIDPLASYLGQGAATVGSGQAAAAGVAQHTSSGKVVILESAPSAQATEQAVHAQSLASGLPYGICGCGYYTSPTKLLDWAHGGALLQQDGQLPGTRLTEGPDFVATAKQAIGASVSDSFADRNLSTITEWRSGTAQWITAPNTNGSLPGGAGGGTTGIGILSGSVTNPARTQTTQNLVANAAAAAAPANKIVEENLKQGNPESEWGIDGAGSDNIQGFATDISVDNGKTINFKIDTDSNNYRIDIYRLGYYGGMGARKVDTIQHTGVQNQPDPLYNAATGTVDAGNWSVSASWAVPDDAVSGVYIAKLVRQDGTFGENQIPFIVRDDDSHSDIVFQTADETWQAYNGWGGANFYGGDGPATGQGAGRAYALSYNRPIATRGGVGTYAGPQDYLFGAEFAGIFWLEQNGYDVSYMSGVDVDRYGSLLLNHKTYVDAGHDEYWSGQQRANVEAARDAGVNLMFWSGNEVYWRTRWGDSFSADSTDYRTLISYKETWAPGSSIDPSDQWTGTFRDPRQSPPAIGGGAPENSLTGQLFRVDDVGSNLGAITVGYDDANLRFWRNTSVANLQPGQTATLTKNYLGYEWDEAPDNGFDPAGLVKLSSTTMDVSSYLLDYGNTTGNATATHNLTLYRAPSGALVFGAGTVYWTWGLSDNHDNEATPTDPRVQQAMVNLLADMGIQPGTLQSGLVAATGSTDRTAPTSIITAPATTTVGSTVTITGTATDAGGGVIAGVEVSTDNGASWHPATGDENWTYSWAPQVAGSYTILSRAVDDSVNLETPSAGRTVTVTGASFTSLFGAATPDIVNTDDATAVELGVRFQTSVAGTITGLRFYKSSLDTGTHTGTLWSSTGTPVATLTFTNETATGWQTAYFSSPVSLTPGQIYTASYHTNSGHYSSTTDYFISNVTSGPLTAPVANNGVFVYGSGNLFPTATFESTNYWVDVMFTTSSTPGNATPVAVADAGDATEKGGVANGSGGVVASGNVLTNDTDADTGDTKTVTAVVFGSTAGTLGSALSGTYGSLTLNAAGAYTYAVNETNAAVQALRQSTNTLNDVFTYTMRDTAGATATASLTITIHGANDAPVLAAQTATQNATIGSAFSFVLPTNTFTDVDTGDMLTYTATSADGTALPSWLAFNASTRTFSGTATTAGTYGVRVTATDIGGLSTNETFNITAGTATYSLFNASAVPTQTNLNDSKQLELGVKFTSNVAGQITAIKFYRSANDNGQNVVDLWSSTGIKLATATYSGTTGSGWQTVNFATPVTIAANTTYIASYHTTGAYVATGNVFTSAVISGPLTAQSNATAGGNGVYAYGGSATAGIFPTASFGSSNYYADVVFSPTSAAPNTTPTAVADAGDATEKGGVANGSGGAVASGNVLTNDTDPDVGDTKTVTAVVFGSTAGTLGSALNGTYGSLVLSAAGAYTYTINEANAAVQALRQSTNTLSEVFSYTMRDALGATATASLTITIHGANDAPVLAAQTATQNATVGSAFSFILPATTFTDVDSGETLTYTATAADGTALPSWLTFDASTRTFSGTATTAGTYGIRVTATDIGGLSTNETFNIAAAAAGNRAPTAVADLGDATEKGGVANGSGGVAASGNVLTNDTDADTGDTKTVTAVVFGSTAGTLGSALSGTYGSLTLNAAGAYTYAVNETNAAVQALRQSTNTLSDAFTYTMRDTSGATSTASLTITIHGANDAPVLAAQTATQNATIGSAFSFVLPTNTFTDVDTGDMLTYTATSADGTALPSWLAFNASTRTFSGTATTAGTYGVKVTATDLGGLSTNETFNITASTASYSLFNASAVPTQTNLNDSKQLELGVKFTSNVAGQITAIKFYRSANDNGQNVVDLWSSTGTKLATATYSGTTGSGWQTVNLATPVTIAANTTYIASYHTTGAYAATSGFFTNGVSSGPLSALSSAAAGGNGVYAYGGSATTGLFPNATFGSTNYYADVVFKPQLVA